MTAWQIYLILKLDAIRDAASIIAAIAFMLSTVFYLAYAMAISEDDILEVSRKAKKVMLSMGWKSLIIALAFGAFNILLPSTKQMVAMIVLPKIAQDKQVQRMPNKLLDVLDVKLDKLLQNEKGNH